MTSNTPETVEAILAQFQDRDAAPPVLDQAAQTVVRAFFAAQGMESVVGTTPINSLWIDEKDREMTALAATMNARDQYFDDLTLEPLPSSSSAAAQEAEKLSSIGLLLSHDPKTPEILKRPGAIIGPCFLEDDYYPTGIAVWVPKSKPTE